jgi:hypothetical protein
MKATEHVALLARNRREHCWTSWYWLVAIAACCPLVLTASSLWFWKAESQNIKLSINHTMAATATKANGTAAASASQDPCQGKEHLLQIVEKTGVDLTNEDTRRNICDMMPMWNEVASLYDDKPRIIGLDTCQQYRDMLAKANKTSSVPIYAMPRIAGLQNSGTNAAADSLFFNLAPNPSVRSTNPRVYNVPWRKHTPLTYKLNVTATLYDWHEDKQHVLPVVVIRGKRAECRIIWFHCLCLTAGLAHRTNTTPAFFYSQIHTDGWPACAKSATMCVGQKQPNIVQILFVIPEVRTISLLNL